MLCKNRNGVLTMLSLNRLFFVLVGAMSVTWAATSSGAQSCINHPSDLVGWWSGDGNANDISGSDNHGSPEQGVSYASAKVGTGFSMDGAGAVLINRSLSLHVYSFTLAAWIKPQDYNWRPIM